MVLIQPRRFRKLTELMTTPHRFVACLNLTLLFFSDPKTFVEAKGNLATERASPQIELAQANNRKRPTKSKTKNPRARLPQTSSKVRVPSGPAQNVLIRRTLLTLNDANLSGNYSVLRDMAAPAFQDANNAAKLAAIFSGLRKNNIDIAPILLFDPKLVRPPEIDDNGMLRLSGYIPTKPQQVNFDMLFQRSKKKWLIFGLAVNTSPANQKNNAANVNKQRSK